MRNICIFNKIITETGKVFYRWYVWERDKVYKEPVAYSKQRSITKIIITGGFFIDTAKGIMYTSSMPKELSSLEQAVTIEFKNKNLLKEAFVHRSYLNENPGFHLPSNERLEFLGDAVIGFIVAEYLYSHFPSMAEGELTSLRAALVRMETLAHISLSLDLGDFLFLGRGEEASGGRKRRVILACVLEAFIGALYLDQGFESTRSFFITRVEDELKTVFEGQSIKDFKSKLQEVSQAKWQLTPTYHTISATGPDHDKVFTVEARIGTNAAGKGSGKSKQLAEQAAAEQALLKIEKE